MAYKRYTPKRRTFKRRSYKKSWGSSALSMASKALRMANYFKQIINVEHKHSEVGYLGETVSTGIVTHLTPIATGDDPDERNGTSVLARFLNIRGEIRWNTSSPYQRCRIVIIRDNQQVDDTSPTLTEIFNENNPLSHLSVADPGRFKILAQRNFTADMQKLTTSFHITYKMQYHLRFNGTAGTDISKNGTYLCLMTSDITTGEGANLEYISRLTYVDN